MVPGRAVGALHPRPREHRRVAAKRRDLAGPHPAARVAARRELPGVHLGGGERRRRGARVDRVAELPSVRGLDRRLQVGREERKAPAERDLVGVDHGPGRSRRREDPEERCADAAEGEPRRTGLEILERLGRLLGRDRRRVAAAVDVDEAREILASRLAVEVPGRVRGGDRAAQGVAAHDDPAPLLRRGVHDPAQVLDLDVQPPAAGELDVLVGDQLEVIGHVRIDEPAEVVVEHALARHLVPLPPVEHRVVLELVLPALDRPDLPAPLRVADDALGERLEVRRAGRGAGVEHEHVPAPARGRSSARRRGRARRGSRDRRTPSSTRSRPPRPPTARRPRSRSLRQPPRARFACHLSSRSAAYRRGSYSSPRSKA